MRSWSRDGSLIAGHGFNEGVRDIWVADPDGLSFRFVLPSPFPDRFPDISPDGRRIAFTSVRGDGSVIYVTEVDSAGQWGAATRIAEGGMPRWSPDGSTIASQSDDGIHLTTLDGSESRIMLPQGEDGRVASVEWVSDEQLLVQRLRADGTAAIWSLSRTGGSLQELIRFDDPARQPRPEMAVHSGTLFYTLGEFEADIWLMEIAWR